MIKNLLQKAQKKIHGVTVVQPLEFGDWPIEKIEEIIADMKGKMDLDLYELDYVNRGGYTKCQGYGDHQACDELLPTFGKIVFKLRENISKEELERYDA